MTRQPAGRSKAGAAALGRFVLVSGVVALAAWWWWSAGPHGGRGAVERDEILKIVARDSVPGARRPVEGAESSRRTTPVSTSPAARADAAVAEQLRMVDPSAAGWETEAMSGAVHEALDRIREWAVKHGDAAGQDGAALSSLFDPGFAASFPSGSEVLYRSPELDVVARTGGDRAGAALDRDGFLRRLQLGVGSSGGEGGRRELEALHFKIVGIAPEADGRWVADVLEESVWVEHDPAEQAPVRREQRTANWTTRWQSGDHRDRLRFVSLDVTYEETAAAPFGPLFHDASALVLPASADFRRQMARGIGYWAARLTRIDDMHFLGHHGIAVGDADGDPLGLDDLYVCDGGGLANRLCLQNPDGTLRDASSGSGVDWLEDTRSALFLDLDNDGDQDLVVATVALVLVCENDGSGTFTLRGGHDGAADPHSMCAADYDNDGDLDLYVCSYGGGRGSAAGGRGFEAAAPVPFNDANNGGRNILLANLGRFRFADVTADCGLDENNSRWSFAASWEDFDGDGDQDLYVANDFGRNSLYRNDRDARGAVRFADVAAEAGVEDQASGMSVDWSDVDGDGRPDLHVGNMFSAAGSRVTFQPRFADGRGAEYVGSIRRMARGNTLFLARERGRFDDVSEAARVTMGRWAWGSKFADLDNDGREDIVVANGFVTSAVPDDL